MGKFINENGKEILNSQLVRIDGKDCFLEVLDSMVYLEKPRFVIKFIRYNPSAKSGEKFTAEIPIYLEYDKADAFASMVLANVFARMKSQNITELYKIMGGTPKANLAKHNKSRPDGLDESRQMILEKGLKTDFAVKALLGAGKQDEKGLIVPQGKPEKQVIIGLSEEHLFMIARAIQRKILAMDILKESEFQKRLKSFNNK